MLCCARPSKNPVFHKTNQCSEQRCNQVVAGDSKFEASALPFPKNKFVSVGIGYRVLRWNEGWLAAVLGFLLQEFGTVYAAFLERVIFRSAIFCMSPFGGASHICCYFGVFVLFFSCPRSRTSQGQCPNNRFCGTHGHMVTSAANADVFLSTTTSIP